MKVSDKVFFIGTKSRGDTWQEFIDFIMEQ